MWALHFHLCSGDFPNAGRKVEISPFRRAKLAGANESEREQFERRPRFRCALVVRDGAKKTAKAFGSMIAARWLTTGAARAPLRATVGSPSARPVATAKRNTCPIAPRSFFAVSCRPRASIGRRTARISGADISAIGREPMPGRASLMNHSNFVMVRSALRSRRFFSRSSAAMASKVLVEAAALFVFSARRCWAGSIPSFKSRLAASLASRASRRPVAG